jgi:hypothetical protein
VNLSQPNEHRRIFITQCDRSSHKCYVEIIIKNVGEETEVEGRHYGVLCEAEFIDVNGSELSHCRVQRQA